MIGAIIQARLGSTRLPGKTLADICGKPLLQRVIERAQAIPGVAKVVVATTDLPEDDPVEKCARICGATIYRGAVDDVLSRYVEAARKIDASAIVRITADDPFKDPSVCGRVLHEFRSRGSKIDYVSNTVEPTWPEGLDVEVFSRNALERAGREASLRSEREHVTPYIYNHPERFRIMQVKQAKDLSKERWTLDYPEDLAFARAVYARFAGREDFGMDEVLALLETEPEIRALNRGFTRNAGYLKSLEEDKAS